MSKRLDYSKWDHIEVSDDEDDTHPNIDTASLFRWRHQARVERMEKAKEEKEQFKATNMLHKKRIAEIRERLKELDVAEASEEETRKLQEELKELEKQSVDLKLKQEEISKQERIINKPKTAEKLSDEAKHQKMVTFVDKYEDEIKKFGMLQDYNASRDYLRDHPHLVCEDTASYLTMWCVNLEVQEKHALMERVAHQTIVMQYILELAKQLHRDPRSCVPGFFERMKTAERQYLDAFEDELKSFIERVRTRAKARIEEATRLAEEEERKKRLGPGGVDPVEVMETLPLELKECFETKSIPKLQEVLARMPKEEAAYHMKRCIDSGLWVPDAKAAGLTPASEELQKLRAEGNLEAQADEEVSDDEHYESLEGEDGVTKDDLGLD